MTESTYLSQGDEKNLFAKARERPLNHGFGSCFDHKRMSNDVPGPSNRVGDSKPCSSKIR